MNSILFFVLVAFLLVSDSRAETTPCNTVIDGNSGEIEFKLQQFYTPGEICTWIIRTPSTASIAITKESSDFRSPETFLAIYSFSSNSEIPGKAIIGQTNLPQVVYVSGTTAVVVFSAGVNATGRGFTLKFEGKGTNSYYKTGSSFIFTNSSGHVNYQSSVISNYHRRPSSDMATFVFTKSTKIRETVCGNSISVQISKIGNLVSSECVEKMTFFSVDKNGNIQLLQKVCGEYVMSPFLAEEILIAVFTYRGSSTSAEFQLYWEIYEGIPTI